MSLIRFLQVNSIPKTQTRLEGPGEVPPVARILMCRAVIPSSLHRVATSWAANIAAYGELSSRSALTFIPPVLSTVPYTTTKIFSAQEEDVPVTRTMVSFPDKSVTWTKVSLNEAKI